MMDSFLQNLKVAARALARQRAFSLVAITTLALGVGATTAIFSVVYGVLLRPLPYNDPERLVAFGQTAKSDPQVPVDGSSSHVNFLDWRRASKTIQLMALYSDGRAVISQQGEADVVPIGAVTPDFFAVFQRHPDHGPWLYRRRGSTKRAARRCGESRLLAATPGWALRRRCRNPWRSAASRGRSSASRREGSTFPSGARLWTPVRNDDQQCGRGCVFLNGIGRLAEGATPIRRSRR